METSHPLHNVLFKLSFNFRASFQQLLYAFLNPRMFLEFTRISSFFRFKSQANFDKLFGFLWDTFPVGFLKIKILVYLFLSRKVRINAIVFSFHYSSTEKEIDNNPKRPEIAFSAAFMLRREKKLNFLGFLKIAIDFFQTYVRNFHFFFFTSWIGWEQNIRGLEVAYSSLGLVYKDYDLQEFYH